MKVKNKDYQQSDELDALAQRVIEDKEIELGEAHVAYVLVYPNISKRVAGRASTANKEVKFFSGYDYVIKFSGEAWDMLDEDTKYILMWHELLHLKPTYNSKKGEWKYKLRKHDFEDFYEIIAAHGVDWFKVVQATTSSIYDLPPDKEDEVQA